MERLHICVPTFFFALLVFSGCLSQGEAIRCYDCYSIKVLACNDPFHKNSTASKEYGTGYVCVKLKGDLMNGDGFVLRREGLLESEFDELVRSKRYPEATLLEKCKTDLCNTAMIRAPSMTIVGIAVIMAAAKLWH